MDPGPGLPAEAMSAVDTTPVAAERAVVLNNHRTPPTPIVGFQHVETADLLALAFEAGRLGTWHWDVATGRVSWNPRLEEMFGFSPGEFDGTYEAYLARLHSEERDAVRGEIEAAVTHRRPYRIEHRVVWPDGTVRWVEGVGRPVVDADGHVTGTYGCVADVTDRVVAEADRAGVLERLEFLAKAGDLLSRSLDVRDTLTQVVDLTVPRLADAAALVLTDDEGRRAQLVVARHVDSSLDPLIEQLFAHYPLQSDRPGLGAALRTGRIQLLPEVPDELLRTFATDETHLALLRRLDLSGGVAVPLAVEGRVLGALGLGLRRDRAVTHDMVQTADALASRAAIALENSRLHSTVKTVADALQAGLAPALPTSVPGMRFAARYIATGPGVEVGGDFYDLVNCGEGRWLLIIGDVCGRGPDAAALNAQARFATRALARTGLDAERVAEGLNDNLVADAKDERFCTAAIAELRPARSGVDVELVVAGHPAPVIVRADGGLEVMDGSNPVLGIFADTDFVPRNVHLARGDVLALVTDGVLEARDPNGAFFDDHRLHEAIGSATRTADGVADAIHDAAATFAGRLTDDLAIVTVEAT